MVRSHSLNKLVVLLAPIFHLPSKIREVERSFHHFNSNFHNLGIETTIGELILLVATLLTSGILTGFLHHFVLILIFLTFLVRAVLMRLSKRQRTSSPINKPAFSLPLHPQLLARWLPSKAEHSPIYLFLHPINLAYSLALFIALVLPKDLSPSPLRICC